MPATEHKVLNHPTTKSVRISAPSWTNCRNEYLYNFCLLLCWWQCTLNRYSV